jgi:hypothetical protein
MRWERRYIDEDGFLTVSWADHHRSFSHRMMLSTYQVVRMLYTAFRRFVESPDYDPLRYEKVDAGEGFALVLEKAGKDSLVDVLAKLDARMANRLLLCIYDVIQQRQVDGPQLCYPLEHYLQVMKSREIHEDEEGELWINRDWASWDRNRRMKEVREVIYEGALGWYGTNLRELRSSLIEEWLKKPEPHPRKE